MEQSKSRGATPSGVSRRTIVKGAAWSVPVIATAAAAPMAAASNNCTVTLGVTGLATCGTAVLDLTFKNAQGALVPNGTVAVTLPTGLVWADTNVSGARTITIVNGVPSPAVSVKSTGQAGNFTIDATGMTPCTTALTQAVVAVTGGGAGTIYFVGLAGRNASTGPITAVLWDQDGLAATATVITHQHSEFGALNENTGEWWFGEYAYQGDANFGLVTGAPPIASIWAGGQYGIDASGVVWRSTSTHPHTATALTGANNIVQVYDSDTAGTTYARDANGAVWRLVGTTWQPVMKNAASGGGQLVVASMMDSDEVSSNPVFISSTGQVWTASPGGAATPLPQGAPNAPTNVVEVVGRGSVFLYAQDSDGSLWYYSSGAWTKISSGPVSQITFSNFNNCMWVENGGLFYSAAGGAPQQYANLPFDPNTIIDTVYRNNEGWWAQTSDGRWWGSTKASTGVFQVLGTPGDTVIQITADGFALAGPAPVTCP